MRTFDLTPLYRSTVGFDRLFSLLDNYGGPDASAPAWTFADIMPWLALLWAVGSAVCSEAEMSASTNRFDAWRRDKNLHTLRETCDLMSIERQIAPVSEVFRLQNVAELHVRQPPQHQRPPSALPPSSSEQRQ